MTRVCFVTDELHPFTPGGIGRVLHNLMQLAIERLPDVELHVLVPDYAPIQPGRVEAYFGRRVRTHVASMRAGWDVTWEDGAAYPPAGAFTDSDFHAQSLDLLLALRRLERDGTVFDVVEFPDYRGWAFCAEHEKRLGLALRSTTIAVRLHTTEGILQRFEPRPVELRQAARFELERCALRDADLVVGHVPAVAPFNRGFYGFDEAWERAVRVEFPPVVWPASEPAPRSAPRALLFATKLQPVKRAEVFVRGAATFLRATPGFEGDVVLACHAELPEYAARIQRLVPADLRMRFRFLPPGPEREALLRTSMLVVSSAYESCSLAAYEAAHAGATLVLNGACPAFAAGSPFRDGVNAHLYDGTVEGLAAALGRAWRSPAPEPVRWTAATPYWARPQQPAARRPAARHLPRVSVVVTNHNLAQHLPEALASVAASSHPDVEVVVVDDASTNELDAVMLDRLEAEARVGDAPLRVVRNPVNRGLPGARNVGLRAASGEYVVPLDADDAIAPGLLEMAVGALESEPGFDVVVPTAAYFASDEELAERRFCDYAVFMGAAPSFGLVANRLSCATSVMRRSLFDRFEYDETLESYEDWDLYLRLAQAGHRFLVASAIGFHYRARPGSMIFGVSRERHFALLARLLQRADPAAPGTRLFPLVAAAAEEGRRAVASVAAPPPPLRYRVVDAMNAGLKRAPYLHPALKGTVTALARVVKQVRTP